MNIKTKTRECIYCNSTFKYNESESNKFFDGYGRLVSNSAVKCPNCNCLTTNKDKIKNNHEDTNIILSRF